MENKKINTKKRLTIWVLVNILPVVAVIAAFYVKERIETSGNIFAVCILHDFFKLYCPACGGTRAVRALLSLRFLDALKYNPAVFLCFVYFIFYDVYTAIAIIKKKKKVLERIHTPIWVSLIAVFIGWGVLRNVLMLYFNIDFIGDFR